MRKVVLSEIVVLIGLLSGGCSSDAPSPTDHLQASGADDHGELVISFSSAHEGNPEIYVMNLDGTGLERLTVRDNRDGYPAWSPDG